MHKIADRLPFMGYSVSFICILACLTGAKKGNRWMINNHQLPHKSSVNYQSDSLFGFLAAERRKETPYRAKEAITTA